MIKIETLNHCFQASEIELIYRSKIDHSDMPVVTSSGDSYKILRTSWDENRIEFIEQFKILLLNRRNACLGIATLGTGGTSFCSVDLRLAFMAALKTNASGIILAHNHPSGSLTPSDKDRTLTQKFVEAGKIMNIDVFDHIIVTQNEYHSFADNGQMP